jgi:hypothetical protein
MARRRRSVVLHSSSHSCTQRHQLFADALSSVRFNYPFQHHYTPQVFHQPDKGKCVQPGRFIPKVPRLRDHHISPPQPLPPIPLFAHNPRWSLSMVFVDWLSIGSQLALDWLSIGSRFPLYCNERNDVISSHLSLSFYLLAFFSLAFFSRICRRMSLPSILLVSFFINSVNGEEQQYSMCVCMCRARMW